MKIIILLFLIGFSLTYNTAKAISYARRYCNNYNQDYNNHFPFPDLDDSAFFVSQCMRAGGMNFTTCSVHSIVKGCLPNIQDLRSCLLQKGWKHSKTRSASFKAGYPIFLGYNHVMLATVIEGNGVRYCAHTSNRCDAFISGNSSSIEYFYE